MKQKKSKIEYLDNALLIDNEILVFSDFHIGYEEYLYGKYAPIRIQLDEALKRLNKLFLGLDKKGIKIKEIVILGDLKHEFGEISDSEWRESLELLDYLLKKCDKIVLIRGNHDNILGPIAKKRGIEIKPFYKVGEICFLHGNKWFDECKESKILILGHLHPAITLYDNYKKEKYRCFLTGIWKRKKVYIIPSSVPMIFGYDLHNINDERKDFFIIEGKKLMDFKVIIYNGEEDKTYNFGKLKKLMK